METKQGINWVGRDGANKDLDAELLSLKLFDCIIRTQAEFDALIASPTWFDATTVALVGKFFIDDNSSHSPHDAIIVPLNVKHIQGFKDAEITISTSTIGGILSLRGHLVLLPLGPGDCSVSDLSIKCYDYAIETSGEETWTVGFSLFRNVTRCRVYAESNKNIAVGFALCNNLMDCESDVIVKDNGDVDSISYDNCLCLTNCEGAGKNSQNHSMGHAFRDCSHSSNCKASHDRYGMGSIWDGTNPYRDDDSCEID